MTPTSIPMGEGLVVVGDWAWESMDWRSDAKSCIMRRRWSKEAGLGALSAFWVASRRRRRLGGDEGWVSCRRAEAAMCR